MTEHQPNRFEVVPNPDEDFLERCKTRANQETHYQLTGETVSSVAVKAIVSIEE